MAANSALAGLKVVEIARISELLGLKWTDLDEPAATLTITGKVTRRQASAG
jgi:integrase